jgi:hypothetical protein
MTKPTQETLREAVARAVAKELREQCIDMNGNCYAHVADGPCPYEGGWPVEVDGEFDLFELIDAAIATMFERLRTPSEGMKEVGGRRLDDLEGIWASDFDRSAEVFVSMLTAFQQENSDA